MNRKLKTLGLALCAAFALSAVAAASAAAVTHDFHSTAVDEVTHLTAQAEDLQTFKGETNDAQAVGCKKVNVKGTIEGNTAESVTVEPDYTECGIYEENEAGEKVKIAGATIDDNDCHYKFTGATTPGNATENGEHATVHLENATGNTCTEGITVTVSAFQITCIHVELQEVKDAVRYNNIEEEVGGKKVEAITLEATAHGIKSITTHNAFVCPTPEGKPKTDTNGSYTGKVKVTGFDDAAHTEPVSITTTVP
jgi:hypothetical protein